MDYQGQTCTDFRIFFQIFDWKTYKVNHLIGDELAYHLWLEAELHIEKVGRLNADQRACYEKILEIIKIKKKITYFLLFGPLGTGEIFLYHILCHFFYLQRKIVLPVVSSAIAAFLLLRGQIS